MNPGVESSGHQTGRGVTHGTAIIAQREADRSDGRDCSLREKK